MIDEKRLNDEMKMTCFRQWKYAYQL